ncbi:hypothetical protein FQN55_005247 [Onygenales sp. PD_40]|nr:hypothetical protein FQN55_005247 [Onygenales sp. PD_40]KAK2791597.1 hypothetical protein FQN52_004788 [Onygenales sp. PD_12]
MPLTFRPFLAARLIATALGITGAAGLGWATSALSSPDSGAFMETFGYSTLAVSAAWSLIAYGLTLKWGVRMHPSHFIALDLIVGALVTAGAICVVLSPFAKLSWITCNSHRSTSICQSKAEIRAVNWRFVATAFGFINGLIHLAFLISACQACHQRRTSVKNEREDLENKP